MNTPVKATRTTVEYWTVVDEVSGTPYNYQGTYVHHDGNNVGAFLRERFGENSEALRAWVDAGISGGGYSSAQEGEPYGRTGNSVGLGSPWVAVHWLLNLNTGKLSKLNCKQVKETLKFERTL